MMYLETHTLICLYEGLLEKFNSKAKLLLEENELFISPVVSLELQYLYEIKRIATSANDIIDDLTEKLGLVTCDEPLAELIKLANQRNYSPGLHSH